MSSLTPPTRLVYHVDAILRSVAGGPDDTVTPIQLKMASIVDGIKTGPPARDGAGLSRTGDAETGSWG
jgi:hypothetical protein